MTGYDDVTPDRLPPPALYPGKVTTGSKQGRLRRAVVGMTVAALLFSACATDDEALTAGEEATGAATNTGTGVLPTVSGGQIDTNSLEGTDTILWFWAPW